MLGSGVNITKGLCFLVSVVQLWTLHNVVCATGKNYAGLHVAITHCWTKNAFPRGYSCQCPTQSGIHFREVVGLKCFLGASVNSSSLSQGNSLRCELLPSPLNKLPWDRPSFRVRPGKGSEAALCKMEAGKLCGGHRVPQASQAQPHGNLALNTITLETPSTRNAIQ